MALEDLEWPCEERLVWMATRQRKNHTSSLRELGVTNVAQPSLAMTVDYVAKVLAVIGDSHTILAKMVKQNSE